MFVGHFLLAARVPNVSSIPRCFPSRVGGSRELRETQERVSGNPTPLQRSDECQPFDAIWGTAEGLLVAFQRRFHLLTVARVSLEHFILCNQPVGTFGEKNLVTKLDRGLPWTIDTRHTRSSWGKCVGKVCSRSMHRERSTIIAFWKGDSVSFRGEESVGCSYAVSRGFGKALIGAMSGANSFAFAFLSPALTRST